MVPLGRPALTSHSLQEACLRSAPRVLRADRLARLLAQAIAGEPQVFKDRVAARLPSRSVRMESGPVSVMISADPFAETSWMPRSFYAKSSAELRSTSDVPGTH